MKTIRVKPRKGVQLAGIPSTGADVDAALAQEWLDARLVTKIDPPPATRNASPRARRDAPREG